MRKYTIRASRVATDLRKYQEELNPSQYLTVTAGNGPHLVIAGDRSGKTRVEIN